MLDYKNYYKNEYKKLCTKIMFIYNSKQIYLAKYNYTI